MAQPEASGLIRDFLVSLHKSYLPNIEEMRKASKATGLSLSTVNQAVIRGKGSAITHVLLICYGLKIKPETLPSHLPRLKKTVISSDKLTALDDNLQKVLRHHSIDEVILFLDLMMAKDRMERSLGLKRKPGRPVKNTGSKS